MTGRRYFKDLAVGQKFASGPQTIDTEAIKAFAAQFDPQPFHLDEEAARHSPFGGLPASGWHSAALAMRLCLASDFHPAGGILGTGGELIWSKPVRPGDALRVDIEVIETRPSRSRPQHGVVKVRVTTLNQHGETVRTFAPTLLVEQRTDPPTDQR
jgi:acyl dehydratase